MRKFWKYFLIILLLVLGLIMVGILYLFFVPGSKLFNITYVSLNAQGFSKAYSVDEVQTIKIESRDYPISIVEATSDNVSLKLYSNSLGFALVKHSTISFNSQIEDGELTFVVNEPYGWLSKGKSYIELRVPENFSANLSIVNRNATVSVAKEDFTINNLFYQANIGTFNYTKGAITGSLDLELNRSDFSIAEEVATDGNEVTLNVKDGSFSALKESLGEVTIETNERGVFRIGACDTITERVSSAGGRIEVGTLGSVNIRASDTNVYIGTLSNGGTVELTKSGDIEINDTQALTDLKTNTGNITVDKAEQRLLVETEDGTITVKNAMFAVSAKSNYGDINITFNEEASHYSSDNEARALNATTNNGKITASGVENIVLTIDNKGRAEIYMDDVLGVNSIAGKAGSVYVKINKNSKYVLTTRSDSGAVSVDLMQLDVTLGVRGYTTREETITRVNLSTGETTSNSLVVTTTSGDLTIRDTGV